MKSLGAMIAQLQGCAGTGDLTPWEEQFVRDLGAWTQGGRDTRNVTAKQATVLERLYRQHFGDDE
ncbi:MAG: hypothetical protein HYU77_13750 [Betaproteobacteria bacterium]|nr:hypothetical protein [Betaproteobacteria bacterium]